jgi:hypothetical protein
MRTLITGAPRTGKSTEAARLVKADGQRHGEHLCTDPQRLCAWGLRGVPDSSSDWSDASAYVADKWLSMPGPWVIEGVAVPRALRKWRASHPGAAPPADRLVIMSDPYEMLSPGQMQMGDQLHLVLDEMADWLAPILMWYPGKIGGRDGSV